MSLAEEKYSNLNQVLDEKAEKIPEHIFVKYEDRTLSYKEFHENVLRLANVYQSLGAKKGDFIGIQMTNSIEFCLGVYACYRIGAVATPLISLWKLKEVKEAVKKAKIKLMLVKSTIGSVAKKMCSKDDMNVIIIGDGSDYEDLPGYKGEFWKLIKDADATDPGIEVNIEDLASCHFTSGTTGKSKGVLHDHKGYLFAGRVHTATFKLDENEYSNLVLPMYHIFGFTQLHAMVYVGGTIRMLDKFDPQVLLKALEDQEMTVFCGVPSIYKMLLAQDNIEDFDISHKNKLFISGAGPLPPVTEAGLNDRLLKGKGITCQAYGGTEDICVGTANFDKVYGSIGKPMVGAKIELVDSEGNILPPGEENVGELVNQGPHIMMGYLGDPAADDIIDHDLTDPVLKPIKGKEGIWYWSGDVGYKDEKGFIYLTDRSKDIAKVSERLVYPSEVEATLIEHPELDEIAVIGVPHKIYGEQLLAIIVPVKSVRDYTDDDLKRIEEELRDMGLKELAKYKVPRHWWFKNQLQTNSLGKVLKKKYREKFTKLYEKGKIE